MVAHCETAIAGIGETAYSRRIDRPLLTLVIEAGRKAINDAGLTANQIDGFVSSPDQPPLDDVAVILGATNRAFSAQTSFVAGGGSVGGLQLAKMAIQAGLAKNVLVTYGIQTSVPGGAYAFHGVDPLKADLEMPFGYYGQPIYFAALAQRYQYEYGLTEEQLGSVAVSCREWAKRTPGAQRQDDMSMEDYLNKPVIATPFRYADCCLDSDGAAAYVVTTVGAARDMPNPPIVIKGTGMGSLPVTMSELFTQNPDFLSMPSKMSADQAYADAGLGPGRYGLCRDLRLFHDFGH